MEKQKRNLIVLCGRGNMGKTTTLCRLIELLRETPDWQEDEPQVSVRDSHGKPKDPRVQGRYKGHLLCIGTAGDNKREVEKSVEEFEKRAKEEEHTIFVLAARTKGGSKEYIRDHFNESELTWLGRAWISDPKLAWITRESQAKDLLLIIDKLIERANEAKA